MTPAHFRMLAAAVAALAILAIAVLLGSGGRFASFFARAHSDADFAAFYCAGRIATSGQDPYRAEPLRACERSVSSERASAPAQDVTPAPLPGYDLALFGLLSRLPFGAALALWYLALAASLIIAIVCLSRVTALPWYVVFAALAVPFAYANFVVAQLPPVPVAALCLAAYLLHERRFALGGVVAGLSLIEPHIGLPACLALFAFVPACRIALATTIGGLALLSAATLGIPTNVEYLTRLLPLHALAEAGASDQLSFTWLLHWLGVGDRAAVAVGSASYIVMVLVGLWLGRLCARAFKADYFVVLIPPAVAMLGGAYVHELQFAAVIPAALALAASGTAPAWAAVAVLAMPWQGAWTSRAYLAVAIVALMVIAWHAARDMRLPLRIATTIVAGLAFALVTFAIAHAPGETLRAASSPTVFYDSLGDNQDLASASWGVVMRRDPQYADASLRTLAQKIVPWFGLILMMTAAALAATRRRAVAPAAPGDPLIRAGAAPALMLLVAANLCITLTLSAALNIDTDESYTMHTTSGSAGQAFTRALGFEFQPPLYFIAIQAWRQLDQSVFFGRLFSVLCIAATIVVAAAISRRVSPGMNPGWLAAVVAFNPFAIWCAVEMRDYALVVLLSSLLLLAFLDGFLAKKPSRFAQIGFVLAGIAGLYTHYYLGFLLVGFGATLIALRRWRALAAYLVAGACVAVAFLPLASIVARQAVASGNEVTGSPSVAQNLLLLLKLLALVAIPARWAQPHDLWILVAVALALFAVITIRAALKDKPLHLPATLIAMTWVVAVAGLAFVVALSVAQQPLANRYVAFLFVPFLACLCAAFATFTSLTRRRVAGTWLAIAFGASLVTLAVEYSPLAKTGDWQRVASYVMHSERPNEPILVFQAEAAVPLTYYYRGTNQVVPVPRPINLQTYDLHELALRSERDVDDALARTRGRHRDIWVVTTDYCSTGVLAFNCPLFESYLSKHFIVLRERSFYKSTLRELERREGDGGRAAIMHGGATN